MEATARDTLPLLTLLFEPAGSQVAEVVRGHVQGDDGVAVEKEHDELPPDFSRTLQRLCPRHVADIEAKLGLLPRRHLEVAEPATHPLTPSEKIMASGRTTARRERCTR